MCRLEKWKGKCVAIIFLERKVEDLVGGRGKVGGWFFGVEGGSCDFCKDD